jgi:Tfp pilus assembly protein PilF
LKDAEKAVSHLTNSIAVLQEIKAENELALAHVGFARFYQQTGKMEKAQDHMRKALKISNQLGTSLKGYQIETEDFAV